MEMEIIIDSYLSDAISDDALKQWLQGSTLALNENGISNVTNLPKLAASTFAEQFIENLHQSFDWLIKQTRNVPLNRAPITKNNAKPSLADEIKSSLNINDHESFPSLAEASKSQTTPSKVLTKRIKPTLISQSRTPLNGNSTFQNVSFGKSSNATTSSSDSYKVERELLKNVRKSGALQNASGETKSSTDSQKSKSVDVKTLTVIEPKYEAVSSKDEIVKLKTLYVHLLMNNHLASLMEEIKFVLETINKKTPVDCAEEAADCMARIDKIFSSYHNCFYFVYLAFEDIFIDNLFINLIDNKAVIQILGNSSLIDYRNDGSPNLKELIERTYLGRYDDRQPRSASENNFVYFQPDTDSKSNFPNDHSFSIFRKQRDDFYKLMKKYHDNNWSTSISSDSKAQSNFVSHISAMLSMSRDVGNCYHLARLFVSQLLKSCTDQSDAKKSANNVSKTPSQVNRTALSYNEERYNKLQDRFVRRPRNDNHLSTSNLLEESFNDKERFFSDFIYYCDSHSFNEQLKLILKSQVIDLTSSEIYNLIENSIEEDCDSTLLVCLGRINLLAKFLGFLCFYPLNTLLNNEKKNDKNDFLLQQTKLRSLSGEQPPILDIESYLLKTMEKHILVVAVPWVVELLIFIDPITLTMSYYDNVLGLLCLIYKYYLPNLSLLTFEHNAQVSYTRLFIQLFLEKLFVIKKFNVPGRLQTLMEKTEHPADVSSQMFHKVKDAKALVNLNVVFLDFHNDIFDFELISTFFPQFSRLIENLFKQSANEVRKITPTCITNKQLPAVRNNVFTSMNTNPNSAIQLQAEECFLNISSKSLKNCMKFINERITATCIKRIKCDTYPKAKTKHFEAFLLDNPEYAKEATGAPVEAKKTFIDLTVKLAECIRSDCKSFVPNYSSNKIKIIFPQVIDDDLDDSVSNFAIRICLRNIKQKCNSWIELNITNETVNMDLIAFTRGQENGSVTAKTTLHDGTPQDVATVYQNFEKLIYDLREMVYNVNLKNCQPVESGRIIELLSRVKSARRAPFLPSSNASLFDQVTLDLAISLVAFSPQLMTDELLDSFLHLWISEKVTYHRVICLKTLHMLTRSESTISTWLKFEFLLTRMLKSNVVSFCDIAQTADSVLKESWPPNVLTKYASLLNSVVSCAKQHNLFIYDNSSHQIVDWLAYFCQSDDCLDLPID